MEEVQILPVNPETFETQEYNLSDQELLTVSELDTVFSGSTDYIETAVYDENQNKIYSTPEGENLTTFTVKEGDVLLNPQQDLERLGFDIDTYFINYNFYRKRLNSDSTQKYFISQISSDRTEIALDSNNIELDQILSSTTEFIQFREDAEYFVDFYLNFGSNQSVIANNIKIDNEQVLIKLYEPLPVEFDVKSTLWVVEEISTPQTYQVTFPFTPEISDDFTFISGPNFNLKVQGETGTTSQDFSYNTLIDSNVTSSVSQIKSLLAEKQININVNYEDFNQFIHFSSAKTRLENFYYKVGLIESASNQLSSFLDQITSDTTTTLAYSSSKAELTSQIDTIIKNFDGYEYFMYFNSGSKFSYPKSNTEPPFTLYSTGSTEALDWIGSADPDSPYYGGIALSASDYDQENKDWLYWAIPEYLRTDPDNLKYELFVDMVGQHYDNIWLYTKDITNKFDADNRLEYGISKDLVADAIKDFGVKLYSNNFNVNDLYTAFLGLTPSGSLFPFPEITGSLPVDTGFEYVDTRISASNDVIPLDDVNKRLYKRIYHNIPYLLKTKGTIAGLRALITSYGIPDTILRINEFGGKDRNESQDWDLKQNVFNYAFNTGENSTNYVSSSLTSNTDFGGGVPNTIQLRFKSSGIPQPTNNIASSDIRYLQSLWSATEPDFDNNSGNLILEYTGSGFVTGSHSGSIPSPYDNYGTLKWIPNPLNEPNISSSVYLPFFNNDWWSIQINIDYTNNTSSLFVANQIDGKLGFNASSSITGFNGGYYSSAANAYLNKDVNITLDGKTYTPFSGSFQELRYFNQEISQSNFYDFTLNPYSAEGNGVNTTPDQLFFRADLGTQLDTGSRTSIHPRVTGSISQITESFDNNSTFYISNPNFVTNKEKIYQDQVIAGIKNRVTDKMEVESTIVAESPYGFASGSNFPTPSEKYALSPFQSIQTTSYVSQSYTPDVNYLEVAFSPQNQINDDINSQLGYFNIGDYIGDPRQISSSARSYPDLDQLRNAYFEKYIKSYDVVDFVRLMKFFDNSLFKMIKDFTPARTSLSSGVVVKQHILERNKQRPAQTSWSNETYSGSIKPQSRNYDTGSGDVGAYESTDGSSIYKFSGGTGGSFERFNGLQTSPSSSDYNLTNRFGITQSFSESIEYSVANRINNSGSFVGYRDVIISDQHEFYDGEFSGSNLIVTDQILNPNCAPYLKVNTTSILFKPIFFGSNQDINNGGTTPISEFLNQNNIPTSGDAWVISEGGKVQYIKLSSIDVNGVFVRDYLDDSNILQLTLPEGDIKYYIESSEIFSTYVLLKIKQNIGDANITGSINGGSENWSLTASGDYRTGGTISDNNKESQGSFKNNVAVIQNQQFWYYNGDVADAQSFFHTGSTSVNLLDIESNSQYYGYGSYNPQRTSNINWFISCSIDYSSSVLEGGNEITQSGDFYRGYSYEGATLTDQNFTLDNESPKNSFIPSPYSIILPDGDIFNDTYNTQIPGNSGSESGEIGGNAKIGIGGTASFKYLAGTDSAFKFNIIQTPQTAHSAETYYSNLSGSSLLATNGDFEGFKQYGDMVTLRGVPFNETYPTSSTTPTVIISSSRVADLYDEETGGDLTGYDVLVTYNITGDSDIPVTASVEYLGSNSWFLDADIITNPNTGIPPLSEGGRGPEGATVSSDTGEWDVTQGLVTSDAGYEYIYLRPVLDIKENTDLTYQLNNFTVEVKMYGNVGSVTMDIIEFQQGPEVSPSENQTISPFILVEGINPKVKAKWELRVTGSSGDSLIYELPALNHPIIELSGSSPISVDFDTVDWGTIGPHNNVKDDMYYLKYTLYGYKSGSSVGIPLLIGPATDGAKSTEFQFLSIDNTGQFDTLQISQSVILETDSFDLTGSLRIYKGTEDNPVGDVLLSRQFIVPTDSSTGTFTLAENLPQTTFSQFKYNETYRMGVEVSKSFTSGLDITAYTMSIFPSSSIYAPLSGPPSYNNYKPPTGSGFYIPSYFGSGILPFNKALDCQPTLNNYNDIRPNSFIMDVDYGSSKTTTLEGFYIDAGDNRLYPGAVLASSILENVRIGQFVSTPNNENVFPSNTKVIFIDFPYGEMVLSNTALSSYDNSLTVTFSTNDLVPINQEQLIDKTAVKASIPDSNYTLIRSINPRYNGVKTTSNRLNVWSPTDFGTYGQLPVVELRNAYFLYFNEIEDPYPNINDTTKLNLRYLIDEEGNALPPSLDGLSKDILEQVYPIRGIGKIAIETSDKVLKQLNAPFEIKNIGNYYSPIMYTQTSSRGYATEIPLTGSGRISRYDNNDGSGFDTFSFTALGTASVAPSGGVRSFSYTIAPTEEVAVKDYVNTSSGVPYSNGVIDYTGTEQQPLGDVLKNDQILSLETQFVTSYIYDTSGTRDEVSIYLRLASGSANLPFEVTKVNFSVLKSNGKVYDLGDVMDESWLDFIGPSTNPFKSSFKLQSNNIMRMTIDWEVYEYMRKKGVYIQGGDVRYKNPDLLSLIWTISANSAGTQFKQGDEISWVLSGNTKNSSAWDQPDIIFFPEDHQGPYTPSRITTIGAMDHLFSGDNIGVAPFWVYTGSAGGGNNIIDSSILVMSSSNINEAYGTDFYQGRLPYVPGPSEFHPSGQEPSDTNFDPIVYPLTFGVGDEIRFSNNENYTYTIQEVFKPSQNIEAGGVGRIKIVLDRPVPTGVNKDFFLIRRKVPNANSIYLDGTFPYGDPSTLSSAPSASSSPGILYPDFPTEYLQNSASVILSDLVSKGIIT